jgi:glycerophosphoryl diester phosphodiesterase
MPTDSVFVPGHIYWQAHRGGGSHDAPDNTLAAIRYGWSLGAIPEIDMRLTADNQLICLHDETLARTTDAPGDLANIPVRQLTLAQIKEYDAGKKFSPQYAGQRVPTLAEVFAEMRNDRTRLLYTDIKNDDAAGFATMLTVFGQLAKEYGVTRQLIVCGCDDTLNMQIARAVPGINVMHWIGYWGDGDGRRDKLQQFDALAAKKFAGLHEVQMHLAYTARADGGWPYDLSIDDLKELQATCRAHRIPLQVFPHDFTDASIRDLLAIGIMHYVTDEPARFKAALDHAGVK